MKLRIPDNILAKWALSLLSEQEQLSEFTMIT